MAITLSSKFPGNKFLFASVVAWLLLGDVFITYSLAIAGFFLHFQKMFKF